MTLFEILRTYGDGFSKERWREITNKAVRPLFEDIKNSFKIKKFATQEELLVYTDTCKEAFLRMIDIYNLYYSRLHELLEDFLNILASCSNTPHEQLVRATIGALKYIITSCNSHFKENDWNLIINAFAEICKSTIPRQLLDYPLKEALSPGLKPASVY